MIFRGSVWKFGHNIDTDVIIPGKYLSILEPEELGKHLFEPLVQNFAMKIKKGDIIVAGENFGCGSSREHAPLAIKSAGISAIVANSFARIFFRNAINIGLAVVECKGIYEETEEGDIIEVDVKAGKIMVHGKTFNAIPYPKIVLDILEAGGLIEKLKKAMLSL
ncbi:MAG: 3-isopropylmalate dehydratase small subunit [Candidatus Thermoplasmatota archaeon]